MRIYTLTKLLWALAATTGALVVASCADDATTFQSPAAPEAASGRIVDAPGVTISSLDAAAGADAPTTRRDAPLSSIDVARTADMNNGGASGAGGAAGGAGSGAAGGAGNGVAGAGGQDAGGMGGASGQAGAGAGGGGGTAGAGGAAGATGGGGAAGGGTAPPGKSKLTSAGCQKCLAEAKSFSCNNTIGAETRTMYSWCYESTDDVEEGPRVGETRSAVCREIVECLGTTECALDNRINCLCGDTPESDCLAGTFTGACQELIVAGSEKKSSDAPDVPVVRLVDPTYASGRAMGLFSCAFDDCFDSCFDL